MAPEGPLRGPSWHPGAAERGPVAPAKRGLMAAGGPLRRPSWPMSGHAKRGVVAQTPRQEGPASAYWP
eukprot:1259359-Karenia_brevis.AAC.1